MRITPAPPRDLEAIVSLLEMAAISLTTQTTRTFTRTALFEEVRRYAGSDYELHDIDMMLVLRGMPIRKVRGGLLQLR